MFTLAQLRLYNSVGLHNGMKHRVACYEYNEMNISYFACLNTSSLAYFLFCLPSFVFVYISFFHLLDIHIHFYTCKLLLVFYFVINLIMSQAVNDACTDYIVTK